MSNVVNIPRGPMSDEQLRDLGFKVPKRKNLAHCNLCGKDTPGNMQGRPYKHKCRPVTCSDCPPKGYPTDKTRCDLCPLK